MSRLSIITLTCNRWAKLRRGLDRLQPQLAPGDEVIVVDTGSTDGTREKLADPPWSNVCLVTFDKPGSWAEMRNCGVRAASGAMIAFLDDDCLPAEDWVERGRSALAHADAVGGIVRPLGLHSLPHWWLPEMGWLVGLGTPAQLGPDAGRIHYPSTSNLWVRRSVVMAEPFQEIGGALGGEEKERYATGREDAEWWGRLRIRGYRTRFDTELGVCHAIDPARLDMRYLERRAELDGEAWAIREGEEADLAPAAYQWWVNAIAAFGVLGGEDETVLGGWYLHRLARRRQVRAATALIEKLGGGKLAPKQIRRRWLRIWAAAGVRYGLDRARTAARWATAPWWRSNPKRQGRRPPRRIAVTAFAFIGDLVMLQGALRGLHAAHPDVEIDVLAPSHAAPVLRGAPGVTAHCLPADVDPVTRAGRLWLGRWLEERRPDAIIAPYLHEPWGPVLTSIRRPYCPVYGFDSDHGLKRQRQLLRLTHRLPKAMDRHELDNLAALFGAAGLPCEPEPPQLHPEIAAQRIVQEAVDSDVTGNLRRRGWTMISPYAGDPQKDWDEARWAEIVEWLIESTDIAVLINAHKPHQAWDDLVARYPRRVRRLHDMTLDVFIAWLAHTKLVIGVDAGPQHLARALNIPTLTLFGPSDERRWGDRWRRGEHQVARAAWPDLTPVDRRNLPLNHQVLCIKPAQVIDALGLAAPVSESSLNLL